MVFGAFFAKTNRQFSWKKNSAFVRFDGIFCVSRKDRHRKKSLCASVVYFYAKSRGKLKNSLNNSMNCGLGAKNAGIFLEILRVCAGAFCKSGARWRHLSFCGGQIRPENRVEACRSAVYALVFLWEIATCKNAQIPLKYHYSVKHSLLHMCLWK